MVYQKNIEIMKIFILFILGLITLLFYLNLDLKSNYYKTYNELILSDDLSRGWVSINLPKSSSNIIEYHDVDTNEVWISFDHLYMESHLNSCDFKKEIKNSDLPYRYPNDEWRMNLVKNLSLMKLLICKNVGKMLVYSNNGMFHTKFYSN